MATGKSIFVEAHLKQPEDAPWKAWQLLSKFLFKWTQISAWRQSGKPCKHQAIINWKTFEKFFLPLVPYSCQFHLYRTKHVGNTLQVSVWEDLVFGRTCWIPSLSAWQNGTWHQHQSRGMRSLQPWTYLAVPEYSLWMMADTLPKILAYISARNYK